MLALNLDLVSCIRWHLSLKLSLSRPRHMVSRSFSSGGFSLPVPISPPPDDPFPAFCFSGLLVAACCSHASVFFEFELIWPIASDCHSIRTWSRSRIDVRIKDQWRKRIQPKPSLPNRLILVSTYLKWLIDFGMIFFSHWTPVSQSPTEWYWLKTFIWNILLRSNM